MTTKLPQEWRLWDCTETNHLYYIAYDQSTAYRVMYFVRELYQGRLRYNISKLTNFKGLPLRKQNGTKRNDSDLITRICFIVVSSKMNWSNLCHLIAANPYPAFAITTTATLLWFGRSTLKIVQIKYQLVFRDHIWFNFGKTENCIFSM